MATAADKRRWDKLHEDYEKIKAQRDALEIEYDVKYGRGNRHWWPRGVQAKFEKLRERQNAAGEKITELLVRISPRGDRWLSGVPAWWLYEKLTWEDAIRPANEPLSVVVPGAYGYPDGYMKQQKGRAMEIVIPNMPMWEQIGGDRDPGAHGGTIARSDGDALELLEIQPVREYIGDDEAAEVGFPFWTREGYYTLDDLDPSRRDVQSALDSIGMDLDTLEADFTPTQRALVIAEALVGYGASDEGPAGWSEDIIHEKVKWSSGEVAGAEYLADEDDDFRREVLGEEEDEEEDEEDDEEEYE